MTIETGFDSNYRKVMVAARRARQLQSGSHALIPTQLQQTLPHRPGGDHRRQDRLREDRNAGGQAAGRGAGDPDPGELAIPLP